VPPWRRRADRHRQHGKSGLIDEDDGALFDCGLFFERLPALLFPALDRRFIALRRRVDGLLETLRETAKETTIMGSMSADPPTCCWIM